MKLNPRIKHNRHKINSDISYPKIRLVGDNITVPGIYETYTAKSLARNLELDLVEISPNADPPVCKIVDYQKFLYDLKKKEKESINKSTLKEIKFTPNTAEHDMNFKINHIIDFLKSEKTLLNEAISKLENTHYLFFKGSASLEEKTSVYDPHVALQLI